MKDTITTSIKHLAKDRAVMVTFAILILLSLACAIYFAIRVRPSDIQVYTHYTSYGGVNFYASQWYYALSYSLFFLMIAICHTAIGVKLYMLKNRQFSLYFGWFSIGIILIAVANFLHIVKVAFPL